MLAKASVYGAVAQELTCFGTANRFVLALGFVALGNNGGNAAARSAVAMLCHLVVGVAGSVSGRDKL